MFAQSSESSDQTGQPPKDSGSDNRYLPRWEVQNRILYKFNDESKVRECQSKDISCAGACLLTPERLPKNKKIKLTIYLNDDKYIEVQGHIAWTKVQGNEHLVGISFYNTNEKDQELILKYAFEIKKEDVIKHWFKGWNSSN